MSNHSVKFYTILQIISYVIEKQVGEDDILFTKPLAGKGLKLDNIVNNSLAKKKKKKKKTLRDYFWSKPYVTKSIKIRDGEIDGMCCIKLFRQKKKKKIIFTNVSAKVCCFD